MSDEGGPLLRGRFSHLFLLAADLETMASFYGATLGLALREHTPGEFAFFELGGGARLALYPGRDMSAETVNHWFIVIDVDDIQRTVNALLARGVDVSTIEDVPHGRAATLSDPEGNVIEIHQPTAAAAVNNPSASA